MQFHYLLTDKSTEKPTFTCKLLFTDKQNYANVAQDVLFKRMGAKVPRIDSAVNDDPTSDRLGFFKICRFCGQFFWGPNMTIIRTSGISKVNDFAQICLPRRKKSGIISTPDDGSLAIAGF